MSEGEAARERGYGVRSKDQIWYPVISEVIKVGEINISRGFTHSEHVSTVKEGDVNTRWGEKARQPTVRFGLEDFDRRVRVSLPPTLGIREKNVTRHKSDRRTQVFMKPFPKPSIRSVPIRHNEVP